MCGIVGIIDFKSTGIRTNDLVRMANAISHRGPDDEGYVLANFSTGEHISAMGKETHTDVLSSDFVYTPRSDISDIPGLYNLGFGHRRLSIIDVSPAGHQPMCNDTGDIWIIHNGEIYNYIELRNELRAKGHHFKSNSDTEVILRAYMEWGPDCLCKFNGMWAFAIWDSVKKELFCARDRLGIKPFYYYFDSHIFAFSSEIKGLLQLSIQAEPNSELIYDFLKVGILDHTDSSFFNKIKKLPQSHYLKVTRVGNLSLHKYWHIDVSNEVKNERSDEEYAKDFYDLFVDSVKIRLRSDVPIGSCLSGGLDSSSVVMTANNLLFPSDKKSVSAKQKTFSACFEDKRFDERYYIEKVLDATGAEANYVFPTASGFSSTLDNLLWHQEEPFPGSGIYAQWEVMKTAANRGVKVILDGQGSDEQLAGYLKFYVFYLVQLLKDGIYCTGLSETLHFLSSPAMINRLSLKGGLRYMNFGKNMLGIENLLRKSFLDRFNDRTTDIRYKNNLGVRLKNDLLEFSLPVLLRYEDKNSMAHAVEARLPFLDYRLVEKLASMPLNQKMRGGWTKYVLRNAMRGVLPEEIRLRKSKLGFTTPKDLWYRTTLSKGMNDAFMTPLFVGEYVDINRVQKAFHQYISGKSIYQSEYFFRFYILELWGRKFVLGN
ncbi:MAG: asparagine synthase (glutamine-hydrolyzing) [Dehalococcoidia bacterium]|jgi:asparagine synthase (glutamine-hydrolysing)